VYQHLATVVVLVPITVTTFPVSQADTYLRTVSNLGFRKPTHRIPRSYTDGVFGEAVVGQRGAAVIVGDVVELSGCFDGEVFERVSAITEAHLFEPPQCWIDEIRNMGPAVFRAYQREAFHPIEPRQIGSMVNLDPVDVMINGSPVEISPIDERARTALLKEYWSADLVANTVSIDAKFPSGFGFIARLDDRIIGGVGCFTVYASGVEVEIDTRDGYRRHGVATELAKRMLVECKTRSLQCHWDAMNAESAALARKVGFVRDRTYWSYEMRAYGPRER
jgi:RimJ/RimL family protein N-acetyltransferase